MCTAYVGGKPDAKGKNRPAARAGGASRFAHTRSIQRPVASICCCTGCDGTESGRGCEPGRAGPDKAACYWESAWAWHRGIKDRLILKKVEACVGTNPETQKLLGKVSRLTG